MHDYHLLLVPRQLRNLSPDAHIGLFIHTPFPSSEVFRCLPRRKEILDGMVGANLARVLGPRFDVLGFDPRGTGASTPRADCFASAAQRSIWDAQEGHRVLDADPSGAGTLGLFRARERVLAERCEEAIGGEDGIWGFMSTASVARDMLEISRKLGQDGLNYWGFVSRCSRAHPLCG